LLSNNEKGAFVNRLKQSEDWNIFLHIKEDLITDLMKNLFVSTEGKPIEYEPNYGLILANRQGRIEGVRKLFDLLDLLNELYLQKETK